MKYKIPKPIKIKHDINGNPRYYIGKHDLPPMSEKDRINLGLRKYKGKQYGPGYILSTFSYDNRLTNILDFLNKQLENKND